MHKIVIFKSPGNYKRHYQGNFTLKSNSKKDNVVWGWGTTVSCFE